LDISRASDTFVGAPNYSVVSFIRFVKLGSNEERTHFDIAMSLEVKHGKTAHVPEPVDVNGKLAEKVDDRRCARRQSEPENEWCQHDAGELRHERDHLHLEQFAKLGVYGLSVELRAPLVGKVVRILDERLHEDLRIEYSVLFWYHAARNGENATKDRQVEKDGSMRV
jgi:hypothetical protein